jgi:hypothetical protein
MARKLKSNTKIPTALLRTLQASGKTVKQIAAYLDEPLAQVRSVMFRNGLIPGRDGKYHIPKPDGIRVHRESVKLGMASIPQIPSFVEEALKNGLEAMSPDVERAADKAIAAAAAVLRERYCSREGVSAETIK